MKSKSLLFALLFISLTQVGLAQSPGSFRSNETHGLGFSIIGGGGLGSSIFYDFAINSELQAHFFASTVTDTSTSFFSNNSSTLQKNLAGVTLRIFPSEEFGFFVGIGAGGYSASQTVEQDIYCYSYFTSSNPAECSGYEGTRIKQTTESELSGSAGFGEIGWQGYDGYYFTVGARGGSVSVAEETDNTDNIIDTSNHKEYAKEQWETAKNMGQTYISFGWHF